MKKRSLDWIFAHGYEVLEAADVGIVTALAACLMMKPPGWDRDGGCINYMSFAYGIMGEAEMFLMMGDKELWLDHCALRLWGDSPDDCAIGRAVLEDLVVEVSERHDSQG